MRQSLRTTLAAALLVGAGTAAANAEDFCAALAIPDVLDLECVRAEDGSTIVQAVESPVSGLNRLRLRELDAPVEEPAEWLRQEMTFDTSTLGGLIEGWMTHPDNPIKPEVLEPSLDALLRALDDVESLSRSGCAEPRRRGDERWSMRCSYDASLTEGVVHLELWRTDTAPVAIDFRAGSAQRVREFEALINGLRLD